MGKALEVYQLGTGGVFKAEMSREKQRERSIRERDRDKENEDTVNSEPEADKAEREGARDNERHPQRTAETGGEPSNLSPERAPPTAW